MDISKYKLWTELDWAEQFKKEEINLRAYFEELEKYLDLPNEDELVYDSLKSRKLSADELDVRGEIGKYAYEDEVYDFSDFDCMVNSDSSAFYFAMGKLASELCMEIGFSDIVDYSDILDFLMRSGRTMTLYMDFLQLGKDDFPELRKAMLKRELAAVNTLVGIIGKLSNKLSCHKIENFLFRIHKLREKLIDLRFSS